MKNKTTLPFNYIILENRNEALDDIKIIESEEVFQT